MRLIDADAFLESEIERCGTVPYIGLCMMNNESFKSVLDKQPTIDAESVVRTDYLYDICTSCFGDGYEQGVYATKAEYERYVKVVRCKDCQYSAKAIPEECYYIDNAMLCFFHELEGEGLLVMEDDFCSNGKPKG